MSLEEESRTYIVSLPVSITIQPDGTVIAEVNLCEASDIHDDTYPEDQDRRQRLDRDADIIENAVIQARVEVK